jgi:hypothetical protein
VPTSSRAASEPVAVALELGVEGGELQPEGRGLGVDAVAAADAGRELVLERPGLQRREHAATSASSRSEAARSWIASVVSSRSEEVSPLCRNRASSPQTSSTWVRKAITSCRVTASIASTRAGVDDPRPLRFRLGPQPRHRVGRHLADLGHRLGGGELDVEPDRQPALGREDAGHLGAGVARDHGGGASCGRR